MKKVILLASIFVIFTTLVAACNASNQASAGDTTSSADSSESNGSLSQVNKILVGTLKLEETEQAVTAKEAATLLPLWQAYRSLSNSDTAAEAEVEALLKQIQSNMTAEQVKAIDEMNLTSNDMLELMQTLGGGMIRGGTPDPNSTPVFEFRSGDFQEGDGPSFDFQGGSGGPESRSFGGGSGGPPPGGGAVIIGGGPMGDAGGEAGLGGGPFMQGTPDPSMQATAQARFSSIASQVNPLLLEILINNLETRASE